MNASYREADQSRFLVTQFETWPLTAHADVAPINSNTAPRSQVINDKAMADTTGIKSSASKIGQASSSLGNIRAESDKTAP